MPRPHAHAACQMSSSFQVNVQNYFSVILHARSTQIQDQRVSTPFQITQPNIGKNDSVHPQLTSNLIQHFNGILRPTTNYYKVIAIKFNIPTPPICPSMNILAYNIFLYQGIIYVRIYRKPYPTLNDQSNLASRLFAISTTPVYKLIISNPSSLMEVSLDAQNEINKDQGNCHWEFFHRQYSQE